MTDDNILILYNDAVLNVTEKTEKYNNLNIAAR